MGYLLDMDVLLISPIASVASDPPMSDKNKNLDGHVQLELVYVQLKSPIFYKHPFLVISPVFIRTFGSRFAPNLNENRHLAGAQLNARFVAQSFYQQP